MRSRWKQYLGVAAVGGALGVVPVVGVAGATGGDGSTPPPDTTLPAPVEAEASTFTLPLFGAPLTIDVATDPGGQLASVAVNPADGYTAVVDRPNRVVFVNEDGTATVKVHAGRRGDQVKVSGTGLADISGPGGWSGDVFGTGTTTTVSFTVADRGDGRPDITGVSSSDPAATVGETRYHDSGWGSSAKVVVAFDDGTQRRALVISASVLTRGDETRSRVSATLTGARGVPQAAADAAGAHSWDGLLCDGTPAHIDYTVDGEGEVTGVTATPEGATVGERRGSTRVTFASGEHVKLSARERDGQITINVEPSFRCDTADPSVNTPVETMPPPDWDHGNGHGDGHRGWDHDRDGRGGDHDRDGRSWDDDRDGRGWDGDRDGRGDRNRDGDQDRDGRDGRGDWDPDDGHQGRGDRGRGDRGRDGERRGSDEWSRGS